MAEQLVHDETPMEYFKQLVEGALAHQRVQSSEHTTFYVVNLLAAFVCPQRETADALQEPLALRLARALQTGGVQQREGLRQVGDVSLFLAGFFSDSLARKLVDVDYYVTLGGYAYGHLSRREDDGCAPIFSRAGGKVHAVRRRAVRGERPQRQELQHGPAAALREVAADTQSAERRLAARARYRPEQFPDHAVPPLTDPRPNGCPASAVTADPPSGRA